MKLTLFFLAAFFLYSCNQPWTENDKQTFMGGCMNGALKEMDPEKAKAYCSCMLEKVQNRYPNVSDARYLKSDTAVYAMGRACKQQAERNEKP